MDLRLSQVGKAEGIGIIEPRTIEDIGRSGSSCQREYVLHVTL